jgi:hypothetical protein
VRKGVSFRSVAKSMFSLGAACGLLTCAGSREPTGIGKIGPVAAIVIVSGQDQIDTVGNAFEQPLEVRVVDSATRPISGQTVDFKVTSGGGTVLATAAITSDSGVASAKWTLGKSTADSQRVEARTVPTTSADRQVTAVFRATAKPGAPDTVTKTAGDAQTLPAGTTVTVSPRVRVVDRYGNPVPGTEVMWSIAGGGGELSAGSPARSTTNEVGIGILPGSWSLGRTPAMNTVTTLVGPVPPVSFTVTGIAGPPARLAFLAPPPTVATNGQNLSPRPVVQVQDAFGNPVRTAGIVVQATAAAGFGPGTLTLWNDTTRTDTNGVATFSGIVLDGTAGDGYRLAFATSGSQPLSSDPIALLVGAPYKVLLKVPAAGAVRGASFQSQPILQITDAGDNLTPVGDCITATIIGGAVLAGEVTVSGSGTFAYTSMGLSSTTNPGTYTIYYSNGCCVGSGTLVRASQSIEVP